VSAPIHQASFPYVLRLADPCLILGQRLGEWIGHAPALEEDLGLANIGLDLIGQARLLLSYAGEIENHGRDEDSLAFLREHREFLNPTLVEQPNGDFGQTMVRQVLMDAFQLELYERLQQSQDARLAAIAAKAVKETRYHWRYSAGWLVRLGDGTVESRQRVQSALERLWPYTRELFVEDEVEVSMRAADIAPSLAEVQSAWLERMVPLLAQATLKRPEDSRFSWFGKQGQHSEHLGYLLADLQYLQRAYPGAKW
jgi:ring-1,2-phenylacetyl-CoA epoxidase subunit PaaC